MQKLDLNNYNLLIFDCDGVILDSNKLKNILFLKSVIEYSPKERHLFKKYISKNKGISRYKFFEYFFKNILKFEDKEYKIAYNRALKKYNQYLRIEYSKCKFIPGFKLLIKKIKKFKKIVISGSNQKELKYIFKKKKIYNLFNNIYGSPKSKFYHADLLNKKINKNIRKLYFGDSYYDYLVAKKLNADFVFIYGYSDDKKLLKLKKITKYKDFTTL